MKSVSSDPFINCVKAKMDLKLLFLFKSHSADKQNVVFPESGKWNNWLHVNWVWVRNPSSVPWTRSLTAEALPAAASIIPDRQHVRGLSKLLDFVEQYLVPRVITHTI